MTCYYFLFPFFFSLSMARGIPILSDFTLWISLRYSHYLVCLPTPLHIATNIRERLNVRVGGGGGGFENGHRNGLVHNVTAVSARASTILCRSVCGVSIGKSPSANIIHILPSHPFSIQWRDFRSRIPWSPIPSTSIVISHFTSVIKDHLRLNWNTFMSLVGLGKYDNTDNDSLGTWFRHEKKNW